MLLAGLMVGCSADVSPATSAEGEPVVFTSNFGIQGGTRSTTENIWDAGLTVFVREVSDVRNYKTTGVGSETSLVCDGVPFFWNSDVTTRTFDALYAPGKSMTLPLSVSVPANQSSGYAGSDILYAPAVTVGFKEVVPFTFYHQLCRIVVSVSSASTENLVTQITMGENTLKLSGNITTFGVSGANAVGTPVAWSGLSGTATVTMYRNTALSNDSERFAVYECMLPPQSGNDYDKALFTISTNDSKTYTYKNMFDFEPGYQYSYNLSLSKDGLVTVSTVTVGNWGTVSFSSGNADVPDDIH